MKNNGDVYETLSLFLTRYGVPPNMAMDGSKEKTVGSFRKKCQEAYFHIKQMEPYSPWKFLAEDIIRELKRVLVGKFSELE